MLTLKKSYEFQRTLKKGKWYGGTLLHVYLFPTCKKENYVGIAVGKKVSKSSVKRNRIKRLLREAYRLHESEISNGLNIVIVWKTTCACEEASFNAVEKDLLKCFAKADVLKAHKNICQEDDENV